MTQPVWSHVLTVCLDFEGISYSQLPGRLSPDYKYLHTRQIFHQLSVPHKLYPNVKDILLVSIAITSNHRRTFLFHINTLACIKADIAHAQEFILMFMNNNL